MNYSSTETCSFAGEFIEAGINKIKKKKPQDNFHLFVKKKKVPLALLLNLRQLWPEGLGEEGRFCLHYSSP